MTIKEVVIIERKIKWFHCNMPPAGTEGEISQKTLLLDAFQRS
jgi:hypothetical protein